MTTTEPQDNTIRLASIVAVDMCGFSTMSEKDQQRAARQVEALRGRVQAIASANGGRIFNTAGDGFMLEFASAGSALGAIQDLLDKRPKNEPDIRIGAHVGDVVVTLNTDLLGHGVNVAARLQALAAPNTALVSGEFRSMARNSPAAAFVSRGRQPLDNIEQRVHTFAILSNKARTRRLLTRIGAGAGALAIAVALVFVTPPALDFLQRQQFLRPQAAASPSDPDHAAAPPIVAPAPTPTVAPVQAVTAPPAAPRPGDTVRDCETCPELVLLPGGTFQMGSPAGQSGAFDTERPLHEVRIAPFAAGKYEVTYAEWDACASAGGCARLFPSDRGWGRGRRPVVGVSWRDAQAYIAWLNGTTSGPDYRLLSEAEWEYAARAGAGTRFALGDQIARSQAVYSARQTDPVGTYAANAFGLFDMHGNAAEWVADCHNATYLGAPSDGRAWTSGQCANRIYRGGAWRDQASALRAANRRRANAGLRDSTIGFRVARDVN